MGSAEAGDLSWTMSVITDAILLAAFAAQGSWGCDGRVRGQRTTVVFRPLGSRDTSRATKQKGEGRGNLEVIGAGHERTGTRSLKEALEILGFGPCYHVEELLAHPERVQGWQRATAGEPVDWEALLAGYRSAVDFPVYPLYRPLMERYPEAKVILTVRDPEAW